MTDLDILEQTDTHRLRLVPDGDCPDPRTDYDHFCGALTLPSRNYVDVAEPGPLADWWRDLLGRRDPDAAVRIVDRYVRRVSGVTYLTSVHADGPRVLWYVTPVMAQPAGTPFDRLGALLEGEANEYSAWAEGDVWGYVIEQQVTWRRETDVPTPPSHVMLPESMTSWEDVDSCWGFIGREWAEQAGREAFAAYRTAAA